MALRGLKTLTAANIGVLLLVAMGLVDFIGMIFQQKALTREELEKGRLLVRALESHLPGGFPEAPFPDSLKVKLDDFVERSGFPCALLQGPTSGPVTLGKTPCPFDADLEKAARKALIAGKETLSPFGAAWGVFWRQDRGIVLSAPIAGGPPLSGKISVVVPLEGIYAGLRDSQKLLFVYILVNAVLLTGIGLYRVSRAYFRPVQRLARRAEGYSEEEGLPFLVRKEDDELGRLSQSLNLMLERISKDKERLKSTIASLEQANRDLRQAQQEIIRTEKFASVGRLASGIAHEIGNPLGIVAGYLELIGRRDLGEDERNDYVQRSIKEVDRINRVIRQLLDFSRSGGKGAEPFSVHEAVGDIVRMLKPQPLLSGIDFNLSFLAQKDRIVGDPDQLRQVLLNLVLNAADAIASKAGTASGTITLSTENRFPESGDDEGPLQIRVAVIDDGPGIPEENLGAIFDPFFTTKAPGKGTGLGLWVSLMIVEGFGGRIKAESRPGEGTTLEVLLPLHGEKAPSGDTAQAPDGTGRP